MVRVFVSHPLSGDFEGNRARVNRICKRIAESGRLPISPLHLFSFYDSEDDELREAIMQVCFRLIDICDEVWVYGDSDGCRREAAYARSIGKSVRYCPQSTRTVKAIKRRRSQKGYFKFKLQCPECNRMVKGHMHSDEYSGEYICDCGAVLQAMVYRHYEWLTG